MIYLVAHNYVKPENVETFKQLASQLIQASRQEDDCFLYDLTNDDPNASKLTFIEAWDSEDALTKHQITTHFKTIVPQLRDLCEKPGEVVKYRSL